MLHKRIAHHIVSHVVPTKQNGFIPRLLKAPALWAILGVGVALFGFSHLLRTSSYLNINAEVYPATIVTLTNQDRTAAHLAPLSVSPILQAAANLKVQDMVRNNYFAHNSPTGISPWHWFEKAGYTFLYAGENLAVNFNDSGDVETAWLNSPTHRANVMSPHFTEIGIAIAQGVYKGTPTTYVVELFGMPATTRTNAIQNVQVPVVTNALSPKISQAPIVLSTVAGVSAHATDTQLLLVDDNNEFISVQNTDPTLVEKPINEAQIPQVSVWSKAMLNMDRYVGTIIEIIIIGLILAMTTLSMREREKRHRIHMIYGILMVIILTSALFVGRIGVFAETPTSSPTYPYLEY